MRTLLFSFILLFFISLGIQLHNGASIEFLPVIHPNALEDGDARSFALRVRAEMANSLGVPATSHTYEDSRLMLEVSEGRSE